MVLTLVKVLVKNFKIYRKKNQVYNNIILIFFLKNMNKHLKALLKRQKIPDQSGIKNQIPNLKKSFRSCFDLDSALLNCANRLFLNHGSDP